jgi:3-oxoacyl-[acyl-carrier protein] reductase
MSADERVSQRFFFASVDASDADALRVFVETVHDKWQRIDALINNAGIARDGVLALANVDQIDQMLDINLRASLILAKECARLMLLQKTGHIINITSIIAARGFSGLAAYAATKAGLSGMTRALARELGSHGIRVNAIAPGYLETDMSHALSDSQRAQIIRRTPLGRLGTPEDIAPWVEFLLSTESGFMTGQVLTIDGGATV